MTYINHPMGGTEGESDSPSLRDKIIDSLPCPKGNHDGVFCPTSYCKDCEFAIAAANKVNLTPEWLIELEKEQNDKIAILRRQIQTKRDYIFAESMYGRPEHRKALQAMVNAYEICLGLVKELLK